MKKQTLLQFTKRFAALAGAAVLTAVTAFGGSAAAAPGTAYTPLTGAANTNSTMKFHKYLLMDKGITVPNVTFYYEITAGAAVAATPGTTTPAAADATMEILAGVDADKVTLDGKDTANSPSIPFTSADTALSTANPDVKNYDGGTNQQYADKEATLDFSACSFTEPGIYRYLLKEKAVPVQPGVTNDTNATRVIDVYVMDDSATTPMTLKVAGYVLHASEKDVTADNTASGNFGSLAAAQLDNKSQGFTNVYTSYDLTFRHEVEGNQASRDKYFKYTIKLTNATTPLPDGTKYKIDLTSAEAAIPTPVNSATTHAAGTQNPTEITAGATGEATATFYLQHGQEIVIQGLPKDTKYEITVDAESYKAVKNGVSGYTGIVNDTITTADVKASYLLKRDGLIPTGVIMTVAPFAAITALGAAGIAGFARKKKKEDEE